MSKSLPAQPNLRQLKTRAKDLHKAHQQADPQAIRRIAEHHPRLSGLPDADIIATGFNLQDAQLVVAREYGFPSWPKLTAGISESTASESDMSLKETVDRVRNLLVEESGLKAAMLLTTIGLKATGESLKHLSDAEIDAVVTAFAELEDITDEQRRGMIAELEPHGQESEPAGGKFVPFVFSALHRAVGPIKAKGVLSGQGIDIPLKFPEPEPKLNPDFLAAKKALKQKLQSVPSLQMNLDELSEIIVQMAEIGRTEGILALEELVGESTRMEALLKDGIRLAIDGAESDLVTNLLTTKMQALMHNYEIRCQMIIEGVKAVQNGDNPRIVEHKLFSFYKPQVHS